MLYLNLISLLCKCISIHLACIKNLLPQVITCITSNTTYSLLSFTKFQPQIFDLDDFFRQYPCWFQMAIKNQRVALFPNQPTCSDESYHPDQF